MDALLRPFRWVRFLLVWPAVQAYRSRARRSLRWRLTGYNLATLIAGLATALVLVGALAAVSASARRWADQEPAEDARAVADLLVATGFIVPGSSVDGRQLQPVLAALASGEVPLYRGPNRDQFDVRPHQYLKGVHSIEVRSIDGRPLALSGNAIESDVSGLFQNALRGSTDLRDNSHTQGDAGVGVYPLFHGEGVVVGAVVVEKSDIQAPRGWAVLRAEIRPVVTSVWVGSVVAAIPGLAVAALLAVAAARSVAGRVGTVSAAAEALAEGSLETRAPVIGEDEVASLAHSFNLMAERLQQTMGSLEDERSRALSLLDANRQLVANVSHELRTPVAVVRGQVEALEEERPANARIEMALREIDRLESLVDDLFQLASAEAADLKLDIRPVDLRALVIDAAEPLIELARREASVIVVVDAPAEVEAPADSGRLARVVQNLLRNAIRHTPEGGLVRIAVSRGDRSALITVADTGPGISAEDLPRVFERFYRGEASRNRDSGGAGLGLAMAKELVEAMGGAVEVQSPPGEGATFLVYLPLHPEPRTR